MKKQKEYKIPALWWLTVLVCLFQGMACTRTYSTVTDPSLTPPQTTQSLLDYLKNNYAYSIFYAGLQRTGLDKQITDSVKLTLLIPDNDAFARAGISQDSVMTMDLTYLRKWIGFHIVQGNIGYDSIPQTVDNVYFSILGQKIFFSKPVASLNHPANGPKVLHINGTAVNNFDIRASNGYINVLNTPLNAPLEGTLQDYINADSSQFSLFKACLKKFNLWDNLKNDTGSQMTVFAPVNAAFASIQLYSDALGYYFYNITLDTIASWDTSKIPRDLFAAYLIPSRIFTTDFTDAPTNTGSNGNYVSYIFPDEKAYINLSVFSPQVTAGILGPYAAGMRLNGATANLIAPSNQVITNGNNVVQPVDRLMMIP